MTVEECTAMLVPIALALRADMDAPTYRAYHRILKDVQVDIATQALERLMNEGAEFMPTAPKILHASEKVRRQIVAARPWLPCAECEDFPGYRKVLVEGVQQETRAKCPCKARHNALLAEQGLLEPFAALPAEVGAGDEQVYPTVDQLPATLRAQVEQGAARKVLR